MGVFSISLTIAGRTYRLKNVDERKEEIYREAAKRINEKKNEYATTFSYKDSQDLLAMVAFHFATELLSYKEKTVIDDENLVEKLLEMDEKLSDYLEKE